MKPAKLRSLRFVDTLRSYLTEAFIASGTCGLHATGTSGGSLLPELTLDVVQGRMADVLSVDHIDDVLADVLGVVTYAFERAYHPHHIQRPPNGAWIFHHKGDGLTLNGLVLLIDESILARDSQCRFHVHPRECVQRIVHHL